MTETWRLKKQLLEFTSEQRRLIQSQQPKGRDPFTNGTLMPVSFR